MTSSKRYTPGHTNSTCTNIQKNHIFNILFKQLQLLLNGPIAPCDFSRKSHSVQSRRVHSCQMSAYQSAFRCRSSSRCLPFFERGKRELFQRIDGPAAGGPPRLARSLNPSRNLENSCTAWRAFSISSKPSCSSMPPGSCHCAFNWS